MNEYKQLLKETRKYINMVNDSEIKKYLQNIENILVSKINILNSDYKDEF